MAGQRVFLKVYKVRKSELMVVVCDCDLLGKKFKEDKLVLDIAEDFYGGEKVTAEAATDTLRVASVANMVGEEAIRCGIVAGLIHEDCVMRVCGVPHVQFVLI